MNGTLCRPTVRLLLVEDDPEDYQLTHDVLGRVAEVAFEVTWARTCDEARPWLSSPAFDLLVVDYELPDGSGVDLVREARHAGVTTPAVLLTGHDTRRVDVEAHAAGIDDFLAKAGLEPRIVERVLRYAIERARVVADLRVSEHKYRALFDHSPLPYLIIDSETMRVLEVNEAAVAAYGYSRDEFLCRTALDLRPAAEHARFLRQRAEGLEAGRTYRWTHVRKDGTPLVFETSYREITFNGRPAMLVVAFDITAILDADAALRRSETRFRLLANTVPVGFFIANPVSGELEYVNPAYHAILERPAGDAGGAEAWLDGVHPDDISRVRSLLASSPVGSMEFRIGRGRDARWVRRRAFLARDDEQPRIVGTFEDVTSLRKAQEQAERNNRIEAIGRLAGGVAHDFNNVLMAIIGEAHLLGLDLGDEHPGRLATSEIVAAAQRGGDLTRQLLAFSRQQVLDFQVVDLNAMLRGTEKMLVRLLGEDVSLRLALSDAPCLVRADPGQLHQVVVNLAVNARDAMPAGGNLEIATSIEAVSDDFARDHPELSAGQHVVLTVRDDGIGMDDDVVAHVFEPFFTTKEIGRGTGLGLATVYGVVRQSGAAITVASRPGEGTTFRIYLPAAAPVAVAVAPSPDDEVTVRGRGTVLLVEDEESVRRILGRALETAGFTVLTAVDGHHAVALLGSYTGPLHAVVTDVVMPKMTGPEAVAVLRARRPGLRVLYMSGYTDLATRRHLSFAPGDTFLQKPFSPGVLVRRLREVLDAGD